jgi:hypothetical protein
LERVQCAGEVKRDALEHCVTAEDKVPIRGVVLDARLAQVQAVHGSPGLLKKEGN